jgi:holo-[acyl-carrier protein] synthase
MIVGVGIDLVETARLGRLLEHYGARIEERLYTARELAQCGHRRDRVVALAARFAAKEAFLKALGQGLWDGIGLREIEVASEPTGQPRLELSGAAAARLAAAAVTRVHLSLTHERSVAAAVVILER